MRAVPLGINVPHPSLAEARGTFSLKREKESGDRGHENDKGSSRRYLSTNGSDSEAR
jgi:hypothetical protein